MTASRTPPSASASRPRLEPSTRIQFLPGVGPVRARAYERLRLVTLEHLARHYPRDWLDASHFALVKDLVPGQLMTVVGEVKRAAALRTRGGRGDFVATISDGTGTLGCYFFGQAFLARTLVPGTRVVVSGEFDPVERRMQNPMFEVEGEDLATLLHAGRRVPVHGLGRGITAHGMRTAVSRALEAVADTIPDPVPAAVAAAHRLGPLGAALRAIHFPGSLAELEAARRRLAFEELFELQMVMELRRHVISQEGRGLAMTSSGGLAREVEAALPFTLTEDQRGAIADVAADLARTRPMHRLVVGDVGSGKTAVALLAAAHAIETAHQVAFMAPTEVLARQHATTLGRLRRGTRLEVATLTGSTPATQRRLLQARLLAGEPLLLVGTHALLEKKLQMPKLGLAIVDEQHRFGVRHRATLASKGVLPHVLVLTATPIPRTLQLACYGDLDVSLLRTRPAGRGRRVTRVTDEGKLPQVIEFMARELAAGRQAYVVVSAIEEGARAEIRAAESEVESLRAQPLLSRWRIGLLHGRLRTEEKLAVMDAFQKGELHVLVATTVIEVGVDVPNATLMVVQNAERFGLTQLHQLRGRVGRGEHRSVCVFVAGRAVPASGRERLAVMAGTDDGFELAEADLRMRGPGDLWGTRQAGLPSLKVADPWRDVSLLYEAREAAQAVVAADPRLADPAHAALRAALVANYREPLELALVG
ncbi:MAG: ATP-dependent DNA helicase RecG [Candidatus Eisenbacteria bacterium]|nr:ATP-dependent DNA helicase RecG [Candidatus Eisenbacteria bacterium]